MSTAYLSILPMYRFNNNIFQEMVLPSELNNQQVIDNIILTCADFGVVYPDPDFMQFAIGIWSKRELSVWEELWDTLQYEYNPIENYDRQEEWDENGKETQHDTNNTEQSDKGTVNTSGDINYGKNINHQYNSTDTKSVSAYNSSDYEPANQLTYGGKDTDAETGRDTSSANESRDLAFISDNTYDSSKNNNLNHKGRIHGNIGVTTTQKMIQEQREIVEFNLIKYIVNSFKKEFCITVY